MRVFLLLISAAHAAAQSIIACGVARQGTPLTLACPSGLFVGSIQYARLGSNVGTCGTYQVGVSVPCTAGAVPYVNVKDVHAAYKAALKEGAEEMAPPMKAMEGVTIAVVRAPGGVPTRP